MTDDDLLDDDEYDDEFGDDSPEDEFSEEVDCPHCGASIYEDAEQCPICGEYVTHTHNVWAKRSVAWVVLGLAGIGAVIVALSGLM